MTTTQFTTADGFKIEYFLETLTLRKIRHWREHHLEFCEAWMQGADGVEQRWHSPPLHIQGRAGHKYLLCWARVTATRNFELVAACNLSTRQHRLSTEGGLVRRLFAPARLGRYAFWISAAAAIGIGAACEFNLNGLRHAAWSGLSAWHLFVAPFVAGIVGRCVSAYRDARDPARSFDAEVESAVSSRRKLRQQG
jgi:hypothetical protein